MEEGEGPLRSMDAKPEQNICVEAATSLLMNILTQWIKQEPSDVVISSLDDQLPVMGQPAASFSEDEEMEESGPALVDWV